MTKRLEPNARKSRDERVVSLKDEGHATKRVASRIGLSESRVNAIRREAEQKAEGGQDAANEKADEGTKTVS